MSNLIIDYKVITWVGMLHIEKAPQTPVSQSTKPLF